MKSTNNQNSLALNNYGAAELKVYSANAAFKGFAFTLLVILTVILIGLLIKKEVEKITEPVTMPPTVIETIFIKNKLPDIVQPAGNPATQTEIFEGTTKVSGDFKAVDDDKAKIKSDDIAAGPDIAISAPTLGKGDNILQTLPQVNTNTTINVPEQKIELPKEGEYQYADVEPVIDLNRLQSSITYPALAKKVGIEGKVYLSVLIAKDGSVLEAKIDESDNMLLNESALNAVKTPGIFSPAIRNHQPIDYWVLIPINFRLK